MQLLKHDDSGEKWDKQNPMVVSNAYSDPRHNPCSLECLEIVVGCKLTGGYLFWDAIARTGVELR